MSQLSQWARNRRRDVQEGEAMRVWIVVLIAMVVGCGCGGPDFESPLFGGGAAGVGGNGGGTWATSSSESSSRGSSYWPGDGGYVAGSGSGGGGGASGGGGSGGGSSASAGTGGAGASGTGGTGGTSYGPAHAFMGKVSSFFVTQLGCSPAGSHAADAAWFCSHLYGTGCVAEAGWALAQEGPATMVHSGTNCFTPDAGVGVTGTVCIGGPCKIGDYADSFGGLTNLVCDCP